MTLDSPPGPQKRRPDVKLVINNDVSAPPALEENEQPAEIREKPFADTAIHAAIARMTFGISPISLLEAYQDWFLHLMISPGQQMHLAKKAGEKMWRLTHYMTRCALTEDDAEPCIAPLPNDRRFAHPEWRKWPFNVIHQGFLLQQQWWHNATMHVPGVTPQNAKMAEFYSRQILDIFSPANFPLSNPEVLKQTHNRMGYNFIQGYANYLEDLTHLFLDTKPNEQEGFRVGQELAQTPGAVVYRNELMELIQYEPVTKKVQAEPILITPAWIMKYYILDLSPHNSLVQYLVSQGFTVFVISWVNPDATMRDTSFDDYREKGLEKAIDVVADIVDGKRIHAVGYCLGGTLLAIEAARLAREHDRRLASISLLAAQVDFTEAGELTLFINESQVNFIEDLMRQKGYLDADRMAGAFQLLRSQDLIWSRFVRRYLMGSVASKNDLTAWNADATRMPYRMHSDYLRRLFLNNELAQGRFKVGGKPVYLEDIKVPAFIVATETDHISPWRSVFKLNYLLDTDTTFLLTNGGHNAGIVSEPGHKRRHYRVSRQQIGMPHPQRETWMDKTAVEEGSWWPVWVDWLKENTGARVAPPPLGGAREERHYPILAPAPGTYVHQQ